MNSPVDASASPSPTAFPRATLVDELCDFLEQAHGEEASLLCHFAREFFAKVPRQLVQERSLEQLSALTEGAFRFLSTVRADRVNVETLNPEAEGWSAPVTLIRAEVGDRPFIVDTIREYLSAQNLVIHHYIYPVLWVVRDEAGELVRLGEEGEGRAESLVHVEISRIDDPARREEICREIEHRLADVVAATDDFDPMLRALERTIEGVAEDARRFPDRRAEFEEIGEFLRWLREENFVFLGYRGYEVVPGDPPLLRVEPESGLGILRQEEHSSWSRGVPLPEVSEPLRRRVIGGPVLIISKTNAEATVHRRARMDYIGVKKLDDEGNVVGEQRFLGLFTSKAYAEHADVIPILRNKLTAILQASGRRSGLARLQGDHHDLQLHAEGGALPGLPGGAGARGADGAQPPLQRRGAALAAPRPAGARGQRDGDPSARTVQRRGAPAHPGGPHPSDGGDGPQLSPRDERGGPGTAPLLPLRPQRRGARGRGRRGRARDPPDPPLLGGPPLRRARQARGAGGGGAAPSSLRSRPQRGVPRLHPPRGGRPGHPRVREDEERGARGRRGAPRAPRPRPGRGVPRRHRPEALPLGAEARPLGLHADPGQRRSAGDGGDSLLALGAGAEGDDDLLLRRPGPRGPADPAGTRRHPLRGAPRHPQGRDVERCLQRPGAEGRAALEGGRRPADVRQLRLPDRRAPRPLRSGAGAGALPGGRPPPRRAVPGALRPGARREQGRRKREQGRPTPSASRSPTRWRG